LFFFFFVGVGWGCGLLFLFVFLLVGGVGGVGGFFWGGGGARKQECEMWNNDEISTSPRDLGILYKPLLAENCQNLKMTAIGRNM